MGADLRSALKTQRCPGPAQANAVSGAAGYLDVLEGAHRAGPAMLSRNRRPSRQKPRTGAMPRHWRRPGSRDHRSARRGLRIVANRATASSTRTPARSSRAVRTSRSSTECICSNSPARFHECRAPFARNLVVIFDDIFPNHPLQAERDRQTQVWTGDVWKSWLPSPASQGTAADSDRCRPNRIAADCRARSGKAGIASAVTTRWSAPLRRPAYRVPAEIMNRAGALAPADTRIWDLLALLGRAREAGLPTRP